MKNPILQRLQDDLERELFGVTKEGCCVKCKEAFSEKNVFTKAGWAETKISKLCEKCWNDICKED